MANFVLVHGAWHGAWCWSRIQPALVRAGHVAHAVTLTGVGERAHLLSKDITLETHITDVIGLIEAEELQDIVLDVVTTPPGTRVPLESICSADTGNAPQ